MVSPPFAQGVIWSTCNLTPLLSIGLLPHDWQRNPSRSKIEKRNLVDIFLSVLFLSIVFSENDLMVLFFSELPNSFDTALLINSINASSAFCHVPNFLKYGRIEYFDKGFLNSFDFGCLSSFVQTLKRLSNNFSSGTFALVQLSCSPAFSNTLNQDE